MTPTPQDDKNVSQTLLNYLRAKPLASLGGASFDLPARHRTQSLQEQVGIIDATLETWKNEELPKALEVWARHVFTDPSEAKYKAAFSVVDSLAHPFNIVFNATLAHSNTLSQGSCAVSFNPQTTRELVEKFRGIISDTKETHQRLSALIDSLPNSEGRDLLLQKLANPRLEISENARHSLSSDEIKLLLTIEHHFTFLSNEISNLNPSNDTNKMLEGLFAPHHD